MDEIKEKWLEDVKKYWNRQEPKLLVANALPISFNNFFEIAQSSNNKYQSIALNIFLFYKNFTILDFRDGDEN